MALKLKQQLPSGAAAEFWLIIETNINWLKRYARVTLGGYVSEKAYYDGCEPITAVSFDYDSNDFPFDDVTEIVRAAYAEVRKPKLEKPDEKGDPVNRNPFTDADEVDEKGGNGGRK